MTSPFMLALLDGRRYIPHILLSHELLPSMIRFILRWDTVSVTTLMLLPSSHFPRLWCPPFFSRRSPVVSETRDVGKSSTFALLGDHDYVLQSSLLLNAFTAKNRHGIYTGGYHPHPLYILLVKMKIHLKSFIPSATTSWNRLTRGYFP